MLSARDLQQFPKSLQRTEDTGAWGLTARLSSVPGMRTSRVRLRLRTLQTFDPDRESVIFGRLLPRLGLVLVERET